MLEDNTLPQYGPLAVALHLVGNPPEDHPPAGFH